MKREEKDSITTEHMVILSTDKLENSVKQILTSGELKENPRVANAILQIVLTVQNVLHENYHFNDAKDEILKASHSPLEKNEIDISKSGLASLPLILQILELMQYSQRYKLNHNKVFWLAISMHTAVVLNHYGIKALYRNILMQFKLAVFSQSPNRTWIWNEVLDLTTVDIIRVKDIDRNFITIVNNVNDEIYKIHNTSVVELIKLDKKAKQLKIDRLKHLQAKKSQIEKVWYAFKKAHYPKYENSELKENKEISDIKPSRSKPINLSKNINKSIDSLEPEPYHWDTPSDDIEQFTGNIQQNFIKPELEIDDNLPYSFEEGLDCFEQPYISYDTLPDPLIRHVIPLQNIELTISQNYISQRELAFNSNPRLLPIQSYQALFRALVYDAAELQNNEGKLSDSEHNNLVCASMLLLSLITAMPLKSLMNKQFLKSKQIFKVGDKRAYIQHKLGITIRDTHINKNKFKNQTDVIKLPIPLLLIQSILKHETPDKTHFIAYLKTLRKQLELPYLSISRIETTLRTVLSRYTPNCNSHIADLLCRTPAPHAPAMYYSSHTSESLIKNYKSALTILNKDELSDSDSKGLDLSYISTWHKYTVGSAFVLKIDTVIEIIDALYLWAEDSNTSEVHFDRTTLYVWFVFCLLTGVRPNNNLGNMDNLDLDVNGSWLVIDDKPNRAEKSHRLIPLCTTLVEILRAYQNYLVDYQLNNQQNAQINRVIDELRFSESISLLRLLSSSYDALKPIKRGKVYKLTKNIIDLNPYWTRHFVRTQLEQRSVNIELVNSIIGHERSRQQVLGKYSSFSKHDIRKVSKTFDEIAYDLGVNRDALLPKISLNTKG